jgi:hypothetical protein
MGGRMAFGSAYRLYSVPFAVVLSSAILRATLYALHPEKNVSRVSSKMQLTKFSNQDL